MAIMADQSTRTVDDSALRRNGRSPQDDLRWWLADDDKLHSSVWTVADRIRENQSTRRSYQYLYHLAYDGEDVAARFPQAFPGGSFGGVTSGRRIPITFNIIQNAVDTASSMIAKNRPKPKFLTDNGDYKDLVKADKLTRYVSGVFDDAGVYGEAERVFTDAGVYGLGAMKLAIEDDRISCEAVNPIEILVDELEGRRRQPTQVHHCKLVERDALIALFPEFEEEIRKTAPLELSVSDRTVRDVIIVLESWHLRSGPKAKDGRHAITIDGTTLLSEPWTHDWHPIVFWRWYPQTHGFWGRGIAQQIMSIQLEINRIIRTIAESQLLMCNPIIAVPKAAMVPTDHLLATEAGQVIEFVGDVPPQFLTPPGVSPELYSHLQYLISEAYQQIGVNQNIAQGQKPDLGPDASGAAIRETTDIAAGRFQVISQRWEQFFISLAEVVVDMSRDLYSGNTDLSVTVAAKDTLEVVKWKDVNMKEDRYKISVFPISSLPSTPAGRLQAVSEYLKAGWIEREQGMELLDNPDLKRWESLETSTPRLVQSVIAHIKEEEDYPGPGQEWKPIPHMNLQMALGLVAKERVQAQLQRLPVKVLNLIEQYGADIDFLMKQSAPPPQAMPPEMGPPGPPPQQAGPPPPS